MGVTSDPTDPRLTRGVDPEGVKVPQAEVYLVLSDAERARGFVRPVRHQYVHTVCGVTTRMGTALAETYARDPGFYGATYCVGCERHAPVGEFTWLADGSVVGS